MPVAVEMEMLGEQGEWGGRVGQVSGGVWPSGASRYLLGSSTDEVWLLDNAPEGLREQVYMQQRAMGHASTYNGGIKWEVSGWQPALVQVGLVVDWTEGDGRTTTR